MPTKSFFTNFIVNNEDVDRLIEITQDNKKIIIQKTPEHKEVKKDEITKFLNLKK